MRKFNEVNETDNYIPYCQNAFIPKFHEGSRYQRRQELMEIDRINPLIYTVEELFYMAIFDSEMDYKEAYVHYLQLFEETVEYIKKTKVLKFFKINKNYFYEEFHPRDTVDNQFYYKKYDGNGFEIIKQ